MGLTGGIGSGKSTVARCLAGFGALVVDADALAREVVEPGTAGLAEVVAAFGADLLRPDGALDRAALARLVFVDEAARERLTAIVHPRVAARTAAVVAGARDDAVVVHDVPLLVENGLGARFHLVVVVDTPIEMRLERLRRDRGMEEADARARIAAQAGERSRRAAADVWLDNSGDRPVLAAAVRALWRQRIRPFEHNVRARRPVPGSTTVVPHDPRWAAQAARLAARIRLVGGPRIARVEHIGPTAVLGQAAPDVLHLEVGLRRGVRTSALTEVLSVAGFPPDAGATGRPPVRHGGADPGRPVELRLLGPCI